MNNNEIKIINKDAIKPKHQNEHEHYEYYKYEVTKRNEDYQCHVSIYEIPPEKSNYPYHYHLKSEEIFYVISGIGIIETPNGEKPIKAGDIIVCPSSPNGAHKITNTSKTEMLIYIDCDTINFPDIAYYPKSNKVGIIQDNEKFFYKTDNNVPYYDGE